MYKHLLILFLFFIAKQVYGQDSLKHKGFSIEVLAQPQMTSIAGEIDIPTEQSIRTVSNPLYNPLQYDALKQKSTPSISMQTVLEYHFNDSIGISIGIMYSKEGEKYKTNNPTGIATYINGEDSYKEKYNHVLDMKISLQYIKVPVMLHYNIHHYKRVTFSISGGIYLGFLQKYKIEKNYSYADTTTVHHFMGNYNSIDYSSGSSYETAQGSTVVSSDTHTYFYSPNTYYSASNTTYDFVTKPIKSFDFGAALGAGVQIKLSGQFSIPVTVRMGYGFKNIKNANSQINNIKTQQYFWGDFNNTDPNRIIPFHNFSLGLQIGLKMSLH